MDRQPILGARAVTITVATMMMLPITSVVVMLVDSGMATTHRCTPENQTLLTETPLLGLQQTEQDHGQGHRQQRGKGGP